MIHKPKGGHRLRWSSGVLVVASATALIAGPLNGMASAAPTASDPLTITQTQHTATTAIGTCSVYQDTLTDADGGHPTSLTERTVNISFTSAPVTTGTGRLAFCTTAELNAQGFSGPGGSDNGQVPTTTGDTQSAVGGITQETLTGTAVADANGKITFGVKSVDPSPATETATIQVTSANTSSSASALSHQTFVSNVNIGVATLTVTPQNYVGYAGVPATFTVTAKDSAGTPVQGAIVQAQVTSGPDAHTPPVFPVCQGGPTDNNGQTLCRVPAGGVGTDSITFFVNENVPGNSAGPDPGEPQTTATAVFSAAPSYTNISVTCHTPGTAPTSDTRFCSIPTTQTDVTFTATVTRFGVPVAGATVTWTNNGVGTPAGSNFTVDPAGQSVTDANGIATFTIHDSTPTAGQTILVNAQIGDGTSCPGGPGPGFFGNCTSQQSVATYATPTPTSLLLSPSDQTASNGTSASLTATLVDQFGNGIPGHALQYSVAGRNTIPASNSTKGTTDANGQFKITYTDTSSSAIGTVDTVVVNDINSPADPGVGPASALVHWISGPVAAGTIQVDVSGTCVPGTPGAKTTNDPAQTAFAPHGNPLHSTGIEVCALVKNSTGAVLVGQTVTLSVSQGFIGSTATFDRTNTKSITVHTNAAGIAIGYVSSDTSGTQTVTATDGTVTGTGTVVFQQPTPGLARNITITPTTATVGVGGAQQFTANVTDGFGNVVPGVTVTYTQNGPGALPGNSSAGIVTDSAGNATTTVSVPLTATTGATGSVTATIPSAGTLCTQLAGAPLGTNAPNTPGNCAASATYTVGASATTGPASLSLSALSGVRAGGTEKVTATVKNADGTPSANAVVRLTVSGANSAVGTVSTDPTGTAVFSYQATHKGTDHIAGFVDTNGNGSQEGTEPAATTTATIHAATKTPEKPTLTMVSHHRGNLTVHAHTHPALNRADVHFYKITPRGAQVFLGARLTGPRGHATRVFHHLTPGHVYKIRVRVVHDSNIVSHYSVTKKHKVHR